MQYYTGIRIQNIKGCGYTLETRLERVLSGDIPTEVQEIDGALFTPKGAVHVVQAGTNG